jgi:serine/tyrosine/threonine adenylyltransferase
MPVHIPFDNTYARLPERFFARVNPAAVPAPRLIRVNGELAAGLGLDAAGLEGEAGAELFSGNRIPEGAEPIAQAYAGHQFGVFVPQLGDGRAILLGEVVDGGGRRRDIQLKGSGRTPFSRGGDGKAAVGPVLREYIVGEAMHALGIRTTRTLAAVTTGEDVVREELLPGAVLTRVAASHIRVGTFQYFASRGDVEGVRTLADYTIARHYAGAAEGNRRYRALLDAVVAAQADLISEWLLVGFIHGVMNTDNMSIAGETIDYGPCAFMDEYNPLTVFSSIDRWGRYAYINQPDIGEWNLARFAECLLPLLHDDPHAAVEDAQDALAAYAPRVRAAYGSGLRRKIGLQTEQSGDDELVRDLLKRMTDNAADFTLTFRRLADVVEDGVGSDAVCSLFVEPLAMEEWLGRWRARLAREPGSRADVSAALRRVNPAYIPRNHRVEAAIRAGMAGDFRPFEELLSVLSTPFDDQPDRAAYEQPPQEHERVHRTFCGT